MKNLSPDVDEPKIHWVVQVGVGFLLGVFTGCSLCGVAYIGSDQLATLDTFSYLVSFGGFTLFGFAAYRGFFQHKERHPWLLVTARLTFLVFATLGAYAALVNESRGLNGPLG